MGFGVGRIGGWTYDDFSGWEVLGAGLMALVVDGWEVSILESAAMMARCWSMPERNQDWFFENAQYQNPVVGKS